MLVPSKQDGKAFILVKADHALMDGESVVRMLSLFQDKGAGSETNRMPVLNATLPDPTSILRGMNEIMPDMRSNEDRNYNVGPMRFYGKPSHKYDYTVYEKDIKIDLLKQKAKKLKVNMNDIFIAAISNALSKFAPKENRPKSIKVVIPFSTWEQGQNPYKF